MLLARYSINACYNEKVIPKKARPTIGNRIIDSVILIQNNVYKANYTYVQDEVDAKYRLDLQREAIWQIKDLPPSIELAYNLFNISGKKIDYWIGLVLEEEDLLKKWHKSDKKRLEKFM